MDTKRKEQFLEILQLALAGRQSSAAVRIEAYDFNLLQLREAHKELGFDHDIDIVWEIALAAEEATTNRYANPY